MKSNVRGGNALGWDFVVPRAKYSGVSLMLKPYLTTDTLTVKVWLFCDNKSTPSITESENHSTIPSKQFPLDATLCGVAFGGSAGLMHDMLVFGQWEGPP